MVAKVDKELCMGCGVCVESCPVDAIAIRDDVAEVDASKCAGCGACVGECPTEAISLE